MKTSYSTKTARTTITLSLAETRQFLSQQAAVETVRRAVIDAQRLTERNGVLAGAER